MTNMYAYIRLGSYLPYPHMGHWVSSTNDIEYLEWLELFKETYLLHKGAHE